MKLHRVLVAIAALLLLPVSGMAQTAVTALHGLITDPTGAVVPGAHVDILDTDTGYKAERTTSASGEYAFQQITPGKYTVTATAAGFGTEKASVELLVNQPHQLDFKLSLSSAGTETIQVADTLSALNTNDATIGTPFNTKQIQALPFEGNDVLDLLSLQAGVVFLGDQTTSQQDSDSRSGAVNGARSDQSNVTLDGLDDNDQNKGYAFSGVLRSTRDSVEEFRVVTTNANADSGRSSGAQVSLVTRSGTNKMHGSAYEYYRPTNTVANDWFNKQSQVESGAPNVPGKYLRNTFGGSFGGPVLKDKLFYFVAYEGQRTAEDQQVTQEVPLPGFLSGVLSYPDANGNLQTLGASQMTAMDPQCAANGMCPLGAGIDPAVLSYFKQLPAYNSLQITDGYNTAAYTFASPNPVNTNTLIVKLDWSPNDRHHIFVRGNLQDDHTSGTIQFPGQGPNSSTVDNSKGIAAGDVWTISPNLVNNLRYGFVRQGYANRGATTGQYVNFYNIASLSGSQAGYFSSIVNVPTHNIVDDMTWSKGKHTFQFGGNYRMVMNNRSSDATLYNNASVTYELLGTGAIVGTSPDGATAANGGCYAFDVNCFYPNQAVSPSFNSAYNTDVADLAGLITSVAINFNNQLQGGQFEPLDPGQWVSHRYMTNEVEYYAQDSWKARPNLTITLGIRHTLLQVPYDRDGQEVVPNVNIGKWFNDRWTSASQGIINQPAFGFVPGGRANHAPGFWNMDKANFAPRFAVAWQPSERMNIHAGFGMYFDHFGQGIVDSFDQKGESGLTTINDAPVGAALTADTAPRFSSTTDASVPTSFFNPVNYTGAAPFVPDTAGMALSWGADQSLKSPYSYAINLGYQYQLPHGMMFEETYTGRFGRRLLQMRDVATPLNLADPQSGTDYFHAEKQLDQLNDAKTPVANVPTNQYWEDMFPNLVGVNGLTATQNVYLTYFGSTPGPEAGFRGNESTGLYVLDLYNSPTPTTRYFDEQYSSLYVWSSIGTSSYHGVQFALHQQQTHGLQYDVYYTLSKSIDLGSDAERTGPSSTSYGGFFSQIINVYNPRGNRGPSDYDVRHSISFNAMDELPFGRGRLIGGHVNRLTDTFIGGWNLTGLMHWTSGLPWSSVDGLGWNTDWADQSWNVQTGTIKSGGHHKNMLDQGEPNAFSDPAAASENVRAPYALESGERNNLRGDGYFSIDTGVNKVFKVAKSNELKFAAEAFNVTNSVRFDPNSISTGANNNPYGAAVSYGNYTKLLTQGRRMQFSLRYSF